jgi:AmmeMemoRadiSam system protein A
MTSEGDRALLLALARKAIAAHIEGTSAPAPDLVGVLARLGGAFVTLHAGGDLRGCIGHVETNEPLGRVVPRCAVAACSADPRFPAVTRAEVPSIAIEMSLLGPLERIAGAGDIEVGRHGLLVGAGWHRGLLLPQVAVEWRWDATAFLEHTCRKAGLPSDAWRHEGSAIWRFEAEVFGESKLETENSKLKT